MRERRREREREIRGGDQALADGDQILLFFISFLYFFSWHPFFSLTIPLSLHLSLSPPLSSFLSLSSLLPLSLALSLSLFSLPPSPSLSDAFCRAFAAKLPARDRAQALRDAVAYHAKLSKVKDGGG